MIDKYKIEQMLEPKLPKGINLYNVVPAYIFEQNKRESEMNKKYTVIIPKQSDLPLTNRITGWGSCTVDRSWNTFYVFYCPVALHNCLDYLTDNDVTYELRCEDA